MKGFKPIFILVLAGILLFGCTPQSEQKRLHKAFYFWRNTYQITNTEKALMDSLEVDRLYLRLFDIDWDTKRAMPLPLEGISFNQAPDSVREVVPVVYITQAALVNANDAQVTELGAFLFSSVSGLKVRFPYLKITEWQFDCDWTDGTKDKYFGLLQQIGDSLKGSGIQLSSTIRLHQIKYRNRTGVPPVDRGVVMYYNIGKLTDTAEVNSIYNEKTAANYMIGLDDYPLPLDVALPLFSWGVWFRNGKVEGLINDLRKEDLGADFEEGPNYVIATKDQFLKGFFIMQGDRIRLEEMNAEIVQGAAMRLASKIKTSPINVILYHLDVKALKGFTPYELEQIYSTFR